ncbi:hypothetical protein Agub_g13810, partial [Astrephomene gubernaculifera]
MRGLASIWTRSIACQQYRVLTPLAASETARALCRTPQSRPSRHHGLRLGAMSTSSQQPATSSGPDASSGGIRLTQLSHGGGCGCKIAPAKLQEILRGVQLDFGSPDLLVGASTSDDAAVYRLTPDLALILTTDFFMPIVDDPRDFGRVAAANAISDVYAMGGRPVLALSVLGAPVSVLPAEVIGAVLEGGAETCRRAGIPLAGGHSIDTPEPLFGLVVAGVAPPHHIRRNSTARAGDVLLLSKPLGVGACTTALKKGRLDRQGYEEVLATMTRLNTLGLRVATDPRVHAMTDVTGFGLLGHLLEVCRGSGLAGRLAGGAVPLLGPAAELARAGVLPGAVKRNWESYGGSVRLQPGVQPWLRDLLCDPQTSGGLLLAAEESAVADLQRLAEEEAR